MLPYLNNALRTSAIRDKSYEIKAKFCHEVCSNMATCAKKSGHIIKTQIGVKIDTQRIYSRARASALFQFPKKRG